MPALSEGLLEKGYWEPAKKVTQSPTIQRATKWFVELVKPEVLVEKAEKVGAKEKPIRRTAWLDGLRGWAALLVYIGHHELWSHEAMQGSDILENAWGYEGRYYFAALPGIRLFFCGGHLAVSIFFVISGYVLSAKPMSLIQAGDYLKLSDNLASALFRRWLRLYIPLIVTTFVYLHFFRFVWTPAAPTLQGNYRDEVWNWYAEFKNFSFVFRMGGEPWFTYNFHTWSIPVEFRGSIVIYTTLMALSRCTRNARLLVQCFLMWYFIYFTDAWYCALFTSGMFLCDLDLLYMDNNLPTWMLKLEPYKTPIFYTMFACAVWLGGCPAHTWEMFGLRNAPGWYYLSFLKPQAVFDYKWFFLFWGAFLMVASIPRMPWLKKFFETRLSIYLGRVSFALYLVHGPVLWTLGERVYAAIGFTRDSNVFAAPGWANKLPLSKAGPFGLEPAFFASQIVLLPVTFWLAEMVTKLVDEPSVKFAQWLYQRTLAPAIKI